MIYTEFDINNPYCIHCFLSNRAASAVYNEVYENGKEETGGVFIGYIYNRAWYITEVVDAGLRTVNTEVYFEWDKDYVNHLVAKLKKLYKIPVTILGFYHRHPGDMDFFSGTDERTIKDNIRLAKFGVLSALVNIDPKVRITFYHCHGNEIMKVKYDIGDEFFPPAYLSYASTADFEARAKRDGRRFDICYNPVFDPKDFRKN